MRPSWSQEVYGLWTSSSGLKVKSLDRGVVEALCLKHLWGKILPAPTGCLCLGFRVRGLLFRLKGSPNPKARVFRV